MGVVGCDVGRELLSRGGVWGAFGVRLGVAYVVPSLSSVVQSLKTNPIRAFIVFLPRGVRNFYYGSFGEELREAGNYLVLSGDIFIAWSGLIMPGVYFTPIYVSEFAGFIL